MTRPPHAHRRYLPPAEPPRQRISRGDLVGFVGVLLFIIGMGLLVIVGMGPWIAVWS
jgi:hypothetical protein